MSLPVTKVPLQPPSLQDLAKILNEGLTKTFKHASATVVECPDLTKEPFNLAAEGLCGDEKAADVGGVPYLVPTPNLSKRYSMVELGLLMELKKRALLVGAGAGPFHDLGINSELMPNISYEFKPDGQLEVNNQTWVAKLKPDGNPHCIKSPTTNGGLMANLFGSEGRRGQVLRIVAQERQGPEDFITAIRNVLKDQFPGQQIAMGGVFVIRKGKANLHIMPDFSKIPLNSDDDVNIWLRFFDMSSPLTCLSLFHSEDVHLLQLRIDHTHCFSGHNEGGHYHYDTTPDDVVYEAYFNTAKTLYRIDPPEPISKVGWN